MCELEKIVYPAAVGWKVVHMSVKSICFIVLFNSAVSLLSVYPLL